ncbi:MAG: hypothetical protein Ta2G_18860 [Termitinemataceae bacterium]|nr:MAG: hypothetical protein Ta2G_18860 [Termitinemataceae bacterium]
MKKKLILLITTFVFLLTCETSDNSNDTSKSTFIPIAKLPKTVKLKLIEPLLADGVVLSGERPFPNISSEQEVMLHAFDELYELGMLNTNSYEYSVDPRLLTAKIETPILVYNFLTDPATTYYFLTAVTDTGECLFTATFDSDPMITHMRNYSYGGSYQDERSSKHQISEREVIELIESQFPDTAFENPILAHFRFYDTRAGKNERFWYFKLETGDEYIISSLVMGAPHLGWGYSGIEGGVKNHAGISKPGNGGSWNLEGERMAKLKRPINLFENLRINQDGITSRNIPNSLIPVVEFTPLPLK